MQYIKNIKAKEIFDSRGKPTIEVEIESNDYKVTTSVPSGQSRGQFEAWEKRDENKYFLGLGVKKAINNIEKVIKPALLNKKLENQQEIDEILIKLDNTKNKSKLGANATLTVSQGIAKLIAKSQEKNLFEYLGELIGNKNFKIPLLFVNLINGGKHASSNLSFQEYHVVFDIKKETDFEKIFIVQEELRKYLKSGVGDEGGFVYNTDNIEAPLLLLTKILKKNKIKAPLGIDVAASSFYKNGKYFIQKNKILIPEKLLKIYENLNKKYNLLFIEDPFYENDFKSFSQLKKTTRLLVIGDDLTVTSKERLEIAIKYESINGIIIKPNQIGTVTETLETVKLAQENKIKCIVSHRSGETNDDFIADLAVGINAFGFKLGAMQRGERIAKYNRLKEILNKIN